MRNSDGGGNCATAPRGDRRHWLLGQSLKVLVLVLVQ